jgi:hypothetical protein
MNHFCDRIGPGNEDYCQFTVNPTLVVAEGVVASVLLIVNALTVIM